MRVTVAICDDCESRDKKARTYTIQTDDGKHVLDLCDDCAAPLRVLLAIAPAQPVAATTGRRTGGNAKPRPLPLTSVEDIEKAKKKKAPRPKP